MVTNWTDAQLQAEIARRQQAQRGPSKPLAQWTDDEIRNAMPTSAGDAFLSSAGDSLSFGWGDELHGLVSGAGAALNGGNFQQAMDSQTARSRSNLERAWRDRPVSAGAGALVGSALPAAALSLVPGAGWGANAARASTLASRVARAAGIGAGVGALAGAGSGTTGEERLRNAGWGAAAGGAIGPAAQLVGEGLSAAGPAISRIPVIGHAARAVGSWFPVKNEAEGAQRAVDDVLRTAQNNRRLGIQTHDDLARHFDATAATSPLLTGAEALGEAGVKRGLTLTRMPGEAADTAEDFLRPRNEGQRQRLEDAFLGRAPSGSTVDRELRQRWAQEGEALYEPLMDSASNPPVMAEFQRLMEPINEGAPPFLEIPAVARAIERGIASIDTRVATGELPPGQARNLARILHRAKVELDSMIDDPNTLEDSVARMSNADRTRVADYFREAIGRIVPGYNAARESLGDIGRARRAIERGREIYNRSEYPQTEDVAEAFARTRPQEQPFFHTGVEDANRRIIEDASRAGRANIAGALESGARPDRLAAVYGPTRARALEDLTRRESDMFRNANRLRAAFNSPTGIIGSEAADLGAVPGSPPAGGILSMLGNALWRATAGHLGTSHRNALSRYYFSPVGVGGDRVRSAMAEIARGRADQLVREAAQRRALLSRAATLGTIDAVTGWLPSYDSVFGQEGMF